MNFIDNCKMFGEMQHIQAVIHKNLTYVDFFIAILFMPEEQQAALAKLICNNKKTSVLPYLKPDVFYHLNRELFSVPMRIPVLMTDHIGLKKRRKIFSLKRLLTHLMLLSSLKQIITYTFDIFYNSSLFNTTYMEYRIIILN